MQKYAINLDVLKDNILLDCIIEKSAVATKSKPEEYYTYNGTPKDWVKEFISQIRQADKVIYRGRLFYVLRHKSTVLCVFHQEFVYSFDNHYADCPIFGEILKGY